MKRTLMIVIPILTVMLFGAFYYKYSKQKQQIRSYHLNCLASVIPPVVLHNNQNEIVNLIQNLANETQTQIPESEFPEPNQTKAFFTPAIDAELIHLGELFRAKNDKSMKFDSDDVSQSIDQTIELMRANETPFLKSCEKLMRKIEKKCGDIHSADNEDPACLQSFNEELSALIPSPKKQ